MQINDKIHGFTVNRIQAADEIGCQLVEMSHDKTGARLVWLKNDGENKLFSIAFKTIPEDDTGVFHILEHSVLCGSDKYPVKEPFLELMKGSMNTFLNAMTFPDKTVFPVSSRNDKDFMNLTRVYLDAVFKPSIYTNPCIFRQEGWHIEYRSEEDEPVYKGVVFNEMKGVVSSIYNRIEEELMYSLYPQNCYRFESGGLPEHITDLTYEQFIAAHRKFYHPSNSYIYLDGSVDIDSILEIIDGEYLSAYEKCDEKHDITVQEKISPVERKCSYGISAEQDEEGQTHLVIGKILCSWEEREKVVAATALTEAMTGSNDAPLKRALLDTGLCLDASADVSDNIMQPFVSLKIYNTDEENCNELLETVDKSVKELIEKGIDRKLLEASLDRLEFRMLESEEPMGLERNISSLSAWLYGGDPLYYLCMGEVFNSLREKIKEGYFEKLLSEIFLERDGRATLCFVPSKTYNDEKNKEEQLRINKVMDSVSCEEKSVIAEMNRELDKWQQTPDTPENLASMPLLALSDVNPEPLVFDTEETTVSGVKVLRHSAMQKGIVSVNLYFSAADLRKEDFVLLSAMTELMGNLPTAKTSGAELQKRITGILGGISYSVDIFSKKEDKTTCKPYFAVKARFLEKNIKEAFGLVSEILTETDFTQSELIGELLKQTDEALKQGIISGGHSVAIKRVRAGLSAESALNEAIKGFEAYKTIHELVRSDIKPLCGKFAELAEIFCSSRMIMSITSADEINAEEFIKLLPTGKAPESESVEFSLDIPEKQGIIIPSGVSYSAETFPDNSAETSVRKVMFNILSLEYLWNEVRVKGGAYGTGALILTKGEQVFYSYRDPSPSASIGTYEKAEEFIKEYCESSPDLTRYIISTIAKGEPLMLDCERGASADALWFREISDEKRRKERQKMLSLKAEDILKAADFLKNHGNICVVGSAESMQGMELTTESL